MKTYRNVPATSHSTLDHGHAAPEGSHSEVHSAVTRLTERPAEVSPAADLATLISWLWRFRLAIACAALAGGAVGLGSSYLRDPIYHPEVTITVSLEEQRGLFGGLGSDLSSLASVAGIAMGGAGDSREEAIAFLRSRELGQQFLRKAGIEKTILAAPHLRFWPFGRTDFDAARAAREAYRLFDRKVRTIEVDRKTGLVRVGMRWTDPEIAAKWANEYVGLADAEYRQRQMARAQARIDSLRERLATDQSVEIRNAVSRLVERQMGLAVASDSRREFAYGVIDRAVPPLPSERISPRRLLHVILGMLCAVTVVIIATLLPRGPRSWQPGALRRQER